MDALRAFGAGTGNGDFARVGNIEKSGGLADGAVLGQYSGFEPQGNQSADEIHRAHSREARRKRNEGGAARSDS